MRTILAKRSFQEILNVLALVRTRDPPKRGLAEDLQRFPFKRSCRGRPLLVGGGLLRDPAHESCLPTTNPEVELLEGSLGDPNPIKRPCGKPPAILAFLDKCPPSAAQPAPKKKILTISYWDNNYVASQEHSDQLGACSPSASKCGTLKRNHVALSPEKGWKSGRLRPPPFGDVEEH